MSNLSIAIVASTHLAEPCVAFFTRFGLPPAAVFGCTAGDAGRISAALDRPVPPFDACDPVALADSFVVLASDDVAFQARFLDRMVAAGCSRRRLILHGGLHSQAMAGLIDRLTPDSATGPNGFVEHLLRNYPESGANPIRVLADRVAATIKGDLAAGRKTLAVYYPDAAYRANLGSEAMYRRIREKGYNVIFLFGTQCRDEYERRPFSYLVGQEYQTSGILTLLDFIDVLIVPTAMAGLPERSRVVLAIHDIFDSPMEVETVRADRPGAPVAATAAGDSWDYMLVPSSSVMDKPKAALMTRKNRVEIPSGYMKLDHNIRKFKQLAAEPDSIVFATTVLKHGFSRYVALPDFGESVVEALLENFPQHRIIFRPHPHTMHFKCVSDIVERFGADPRFVFDSNASEYMDSYARSAVMVSDMSGTAFTYAFTTLRPVVFFSHNEADGIEAAFNGVSYFRHRQDIGFVATTVGEMVRQVRTALDSPSMASAIRTFRDAMMFNIEHVEDYLVEHIDCLMAGEMGPDWRYIPSLKYCGGLEDPRAHETVPQLLELGYKGFNLVHYQARYLAMAQTLGHVHLQEQDQEAMERMVRNGSCIISHSLQELKMKIDAAGAI